MKFIVKIVNTKFVAYTIAYKKDFSVEAIVNQISRFQALEDISILYTPP